VGVFGLRVLALFLAFGADVVMTRSLGTEQYGIFAIGVSWLTVLITIASLGFGTALLKVIPAERASGDPGLVRGALAWSQRRMLAAAVALALVFAGAVVLMGARIGAELRGVLLVLALFLPVQVLAVQRQAALQAFKRPVLSLVPEQVLRWIVFVLLVGGLYFWTGSVTAVGATWAYGAGMLVALVAAHLFVRRVVPGEVQRAAPRFAPSAWWLLALPLGWNSVMRMLNSRADPAMLGWLDDAEGAAFFSVANRLASLLLFGMLAVNAVAAPLISELHTQGKRRELQEMLTLTAKGLALYALPLGAGLIIGGPWILAVFGPEYVAAYPVLVLLVVGRTLTCLFGTVGFLLAMTGHHNYVAKLVTACALLKVLLNLALIPSFGALGAAAATMLMLAVMGLAQWRYVRRELGLEPSCLALFAAAPTAEGEVAP